QANRHRIQAVHAPGAVALASPSSHRGDVLFHCGSGRSTSLYFKCSIISNVCNQAHKLQHPSVRLVTRLQWSGTEFMALMEEKQLPGGVQPARTAIPVV